MIKYPSLAGALVLVGTLGCGGGAADGDRTTNMPTEEVAPAVDTSSTADDAQPPAEMPAAAADAALPATASPLPLVGSLGLALVGAGVVLRRLRRRSR
jgi:hypothetical protein